MASHNFHMDADGGGYTCKGCGKKVGMVKHKSGGLHVPGDNEPQNDTHHQSVSRFPTDNCTGG